MLIEVFAVSLHWFPSQLIESPRSRLGHSHRRSGGRPSGPTLAVRLGCRDASGAAGYDARCRERGRGQPVSCALAMLKSLNQTTSGLRAPKGWGKGASSSATPSEMPSCRSSPTAPWRSHFCSMGAIVTNHLQPARAWATSSTRPARPRLLPVDGLVLFGSSGRLLQPGGRRGVRRSPTHAFDTTGLPRHDVAYSNQQWRRRITGPSIERAAGRRRRRGLTRTLQASGSWL